MLGLALTAGLIFLGIRWTTNLGKSDKVVDTETATASISKMVSKIDPYTAEPVKSPIEYSDTDVAADELPDIETCKVVVEPTTELYAEIWSSGEKVGKDTDGWMREMAEEFNRAGYEVDGQPVSLKVRQVASGQAVDYIAVGKAVPDGYTPSNMLWVHTLNARGVATDTIAERMCGNVAGMLFDKEHADAIMSKYGTVDLKAVTEAAASGEVAMGYTNPFTSATGLNFLVSTLLRYDSSNPLSDEAVEGFRQFQSNVPFVSMTTQQMRDATERNSLDGFVTEWQTYANDSILKGNYEFYPFGYRHDNPLVAISGIDADKREILSLFAELCLSDAGQAKATEYGFNGRDDYEPEGMGDIDGKVILSALDVYKANKDNGAPVVAVFVADVSGSMEGEPLHALQQSLVNSMRYINKDNYIGLVSYSDDVTINVPVAKFDMNQQTYFKGAVESLRAGGGTATFDGIVVAADLVQKQLEEVPNGKPMIFVLSDGDTNRGYSLNEIRSPMQSLRIPIYTVGYNANIDALKEISSINEAASINASTDDVTYQLKNLFNANM